MRTQLPIKGGTAPHLLAHVYCGQMAGWIKMPLGTKVGLGTGHILLDGDPDRRQRDTPNFRPIFILARRAPISATAERLLQLHSSRADWRHLANTIELAHPSVHSSPKPKRRIDRFSRFSTFTMGASIPQNCPFSWGDLDRHLTYDSLGRSEPITQTAPRSVQPFLHR